MKGRLEKCVVGPGVTCAVETSTVWWRVLDRGEDEGIQGRRSGSGSRHPSRDCVTEVSVDLGVSVNGFENGLGG